MGRPLVETCFCEMIGRVHMQLMAKMLAAALKQSTRD